MAVERDEVREVVVLRAGAVRERAAGVDQRRVHGERPQQEVDRLGAARLQGARVRVLRRARDQPCGDCPQRVELGGGEEAPGAALRDLGDQRLDAPRRDKRQHPDPAGRLHPDCRLG